jgi:hypothetical protein
MEAPARGSGGCAKSARQEKLQNGPDFPDYERERNNAQIA